MAAYCRMYSSWKVGSSLGSHLSQRHWQVCFTMCCWDSFCSWTLALTWNLSLVSISSMNKHAKSRRLNVYVCTLFLFLYQRITEFFLINLWFLVSKVIGTKAKLSWVVCDLWFSTLDLDQSYNLLNIASYATGLYIFLC